MIKARDIAGMIDHSLLRPNLTIEEIKVGCDIARKYQVASVCVRPCDVRIVAELIKGTNIALSTVIGFPHGTNTTAMKLAESIEAMEAGVVELDMVMNYSRLLSGDFDYVAKEIQAITRAAHSRNAIVKVILENCYLTDDMKVKACQICETAGADFVKTSTGFGSSGATRQDVSLMRKSTGPKVQVKAAGGIRSLDALLEMRKAGATRIGATATKTIMEEALEREASGTLLE
ncbi:MAG: deoxyribose-phosphate aldolase [Firmicutes bacterium]|jgi:deoxyribose-phosphate aldolase|nr:deoxyribose-phosphate aldolase [Bacillota bacterium]